MASAVTLSPEIAQLIPREIDSLYDDMVQVRRRLHGTFNALLLPMVTMCRDGSYMH